MARKAYNGYTEKSYYENKRFSGMITTGDVLTEGNFYTLYNTVISDTGLSVKPRKGFITTTIQDENNNYITLDANTIYYRDPESNSIIFIDLSTLNYDLDTEYTIKSYTANVSEYTTDSETLTIKLDDTTINRTISNVDYDDVEDCLFDWLETYYSDELNNKKSFYNKSCTITALINKGISVYDKYSIRRFLFKCKVTFDESSCNVYLLVNYNKEDNKILLRVLDTKEQYSVDTNYRNLASDQSIVPDPIQTVYESVEQLPDGAYSTFPMIYNKMPNGYSLNIENWEDINLIPSFTLLPLTTNRVWAYTYDIYSTKTNASLSTENVYHAPVYQLSNNNRIISAPMATDTITLYEYLNNDRSNITKIDNYKSSYEQVYIIPKHYTDNAYSIQDTFDLTYNHTTLESDDNFVIQDISEQIIKKLNSHLNDNDNGNGYEIVDIDTLYNIQKDIDGFNTLSELYNYLKQSDVSEILQDYLFIVVPGASVNISNNADTYDFHNINYSHVIKSEQITYINAQTYITNKDGTSYSKTYDEYLTHLYDNITSRTQLFTLINIMPIYYGLDYGMFITYSADDIISLYQLYDKDATFVSFNDDTLYSSISNNGTTGAISYLNNCIDSLKNKIKYVYNFNSSSTDTFKLKLNDSEKCKGFINANYSGGDDVFYLYYMGTNTSFSKTWSISSNSLQKTISARTYFLLSVNFYTTLCDVNLFMNVKYLYAIKNATSTTNDKLLYGLFYDNENDSVFNYDFCSAFVGYKHIESDISTDIQALTDTDILFKTENSILKQNHDNDVYDEKTEKYYHPLLSKLNDIGFFENDSFNMTMYLSAIDEPKKSGSNYYSNVTRSTFTAAAAYMQSTVLPYRRNDAQSYLTEVITKEPKMIENSDGYTIFDSEEGDRITIWKDNKVFMSDISTGSDINNFTYSFSWDFTEPVLKCIPYKKIIMVFTTQNLYAIYPYKTTSPVETQTTDEETGKTTTTTENVETVIYKKACVLYNIMTNVKYKDCICVFNQLVFFYGNDGQLYLIKPVTTIDDDTRFSLQLINKSINDVFLNYVDYINLRLKQYGINYTCTEDEVDIKAHATIDKIKIIYSVPNVYTMFVIYDTLLNTFSIEDTTSFSNVIDNLVCDSGDIYTTLCNNHLRLSYKYTQPNDIETNVDRAIDDNFIKRDILMSLDTGDISLNNHIAKRFKTLKVYYKNINTTSVMFNVATFVDGVVAYTTTSNSMEIRDMNGSTTITFSEQAENFNELNGLTTLTFVDDDQYKEITEDKFMLFDFNDIVSSKTITNETSIISTGKDIRFRFNFKSKGVYKFLGYSIIFKEHHV